MKVRLVLCALGCTGAAACAPTPPPPAENALTSGLAVRTPMAQRCFSASNVTAYRPVGDEAVHLRVGARQIWRLDFTGRCPELKWSIGGIALKQRGGNQICSGLDVDVVSSDGGHARHCTVDSVRRLNDAEVLSLADNLRP